MSANRLSVDLRRLRMTFLLDFYGNLLTEKQRETLTLYCNEDYSLAELAERYGTSRQGVHNSIRHSEKKLLDIEQKLDLLRRFGDLPEELKQHFANGRVEE